MKIIKRAGIVALLLAAIAGIRLATPKAAHAVSSCYSYGLPSGVVVPTSQNVILGYAAYATIYWSCSPTSYQSQNYIVIIDWTANGSGTHEYSITSARENLGCDSGTSCSQTFYWWYANAGNYTAHVYLSGPQAYISEGSSYISVVNSGVCCIAQHYSLIRQHH